MSVLDSRVWVMWAVAATLPALVSRNPIVLVLLLGAVIIVRSTCVPPTSAHSWGWLLRVTVIVAPIAVIFNVLTVRDGDRVIGTIPDGLPVVGGPITANALVYGLVSALASVTLVLIGTTVASVIDWMALGRVLPDRLMPLAVAGTVAWTFLPQASAAFGEIREVQLARGHRVRGVRGVAPILVPLLATSLDRALTTAEALEARGFGASTHGHGRHRTRYRDTPWTMRSALVLAVLIASVALMMGVVALAGESLRFNPFPILAAPDVPVVALLAVASLIVPAIVTATAASPPLSVQP